MDEKKTFQIKPPKAFRVKEPEKKHFEIQTPLSEIPPIEGGGMTPQSKDDLARLVEAPLLEACQIFFDKGVETSMSSANRKDVEIGYVHLIIRFDSLSSRNKKIASDLGERYSHLNREYLKITMPVDETTTAQKVSKHMSAIANQFDQQ